MAGTHGEVEQKKKLFEELVLVYLHDFTDIFAKDGLNKLPPEWPGIDHQIEMKPGFISKTSKIYPLLEKEWSAVKAFIDENMKKGFISESKSPQVSGFFLSERKVVNYGLVRIINTSMIGPSRVPTHSLFL